MRSSEPCVWARLPSSTSAIPAWAAITTKSLSVGFEMEGDRSAAELRSAALWVDDTSIDLSFEQLVAVKKTNPIAIARVDLKNSFIETSNAWTCKSLANGTLWRL